MQTITTIGLDNAKSVFRFTAGAEAICADSDHQLAELLHLRLLRSRALSSSAFNSASKSRGFRVIVSVGVDGEMIVEHPAQCRKVVRTA